MAIAKKKAEDQAAHEKKRKWMKVKRDSNREANKEKVKLMYKKAKVAVVSKPGFKN